MSRVMNMIMKALELNPLVMMYRTQEALMFDHVYYGYKGGVPKNER